MKKTFFIISIIAMLGVGGIVGHATPAQAEENTSVESINKKINNLQDQLESASQELSKLINSINNTQADIKTKEQEIAATEEKITALQIEIDAIIKRIEARNGVLKERARSLQESGGTISYIEVLLGAQSFSDFITRTEAVMTIVTADQDILTQHKGDMERVNTAKTELETALSSIETLRNELKVKEEQLLANKKELEGKEQGLKGQIDSLDKERTELIAQAQAAKVSQPVIQPSSVSLANSISTESTPTQVKGNGSFVWPAIGGYISSYQGPRGGSYHKGIDIARPSDYSILASRGGTVYYTGWYYSGGLTVKIQHDNGYTTEYMHLNQILVQNGQTVSAGQKIGIMGATGEVTGVHLHFNVYQNGNLLNPIDVLR